MKGKAAILVLALCVGMLPSAGRALATPRAPFVARQALVKFRAGSSRDARAAALRAVDARVVREIPRIGWSLVRMPPGTDVAGAVTTLRSSAAVAVAEPNYTGRIQIDPNDTCLQGCGTSRQWDVDAVNARAGWAAAPGRFYTSAEKITLAQPPVKVGVLDTKIDVDHPDWQNASPLPVSRPQDAPSGGQLDLADAIDYVPLGRQTGSADYHGTFVAGILAAATNNGTGISGFGYRAQIVPIAVVDGNGVASAADLTSGIVHATSVGARVINLSLGLLETSSAVQDSIYLANEAGALVVAAAGNNGNDQPFYPAWHGGVMAVAGTDEADRRAPCSNHGPHISVAAPGMGILSMDPRTGSRYSVAGCGTSTATPHVSALAALLFAQDPSRTPAQVRAIIERNADDDRFNEGVDPYFGNGRINFERALRDGIGPDVTRVVATVPRALGGSSTFSANARAVSDRPVRQAEWFIDGLGAPGTGGTLTTADGSFGGRTETLVAEIEVPLVFPTGVHRLFVRARDDNGWGAASVAALIADRTPPQIKNLSVSAVAATAAAQPVTISFTASDDFGSTLTYALTATSQVTGAVAYASEPVPFTAGDMQTAWVPDVGLVGPYQLELTVRDEALNPARARATTILV